MDIKQSLLHAELFTIMNNLSNNFKSKYHQCKQKNKTKNSSLTNFVEAGDNVTEVNPGSPSFCHLVKQVISEKLQQVAVACLRPRWVLLKSDSHKTRSQNINRNKNPTYQWIFPYVQLTQAARWWCLVWPTDGRGARFAPPASKKTTVKLCRHNS